jgi:hypothetical protein
MQRHTFMQKNKHKERPPHSKVVDELLVRWSNTVPYWGKRLANDRAGVKKVCRFNTNVFRIQLKFW